MGILTGFGRIIILRSWLCSECDAFSFAEVIQWYRDGGELDIRAAGMSGHIHVLLSTYYSEERTPHPTPLQTIESTTSETQSNCTTLTPRAQALPVKTNSLKTIASTFLPNSTEPG
jgi:hypothetical protein